MVMPMDERTKKRLEALKSAPHADKKWQMQALERVKSGAGTGSLSGKFLPVISAGVTEKPILFMKTPAQQKRDFSVIKKLLGGEKTALLVSLAPYLYEHSMAKRLLAKKPWLKKRVLLVDARKLNSGDIKTLNEFAPTALVGYPLMLEVLLKEKEEGRLKIALKMLVSCGDSLDEELKTALEKAFGCRVTDVYFTAQTGITAVDGKPVDGILYKAVDENGAEVKEGTLSHDLLLTDLDSAGFPVTGYASGERALVKDGSLHICARTCERLRIGKELLDFSPLSLPEGTARAQLVRVDEMTVGIRIKCEKENRIPAFKALCAQVDAQIEKQTQVRVRVVLMGEDPVVKNGRFVPVCDRG